MSDFPAAGVSDYSSVTVVPHHTAAFPELSDDECMMRLAEAIESNDSDKLEELAMLIGRLAITIE